MLKTGVMSSKGQVVIPAALRKRFKMKEGTTIVFREEKGRIVMEAKNWDDLIALKGSFDCDLEGMLIEERALEAEREKEKYAEYGWDDAE